MDVSALTIKLIVLLVPGILASKIYIRLTVRHQERSDFMFVLLSIMLGIFSYLPIQFFQILRSIFTHNNIVVIDTFKNISADLNIPYEEIFWASIISIFIGLLAVKIDHYKWLNWIAMKVNISNKYGDENLYSKWLNSNCLEWVYVRDLTNDRVYWGSISAFSETKEFKELNLKEVTVMSNSTNEIEYKVPEIYLCLPKDAVIIEKAIDIK